MNDILLFNYARRKKREWSRQALAGLTDSEVDELNAVIRDWRKAQGGQPELSATSGPPQGVSRAGEAVAAPEGQNRLTSKVVLELIGHEAIVQESYLDSVGVWTWGVGVTNASGHNIDRYRDKPQSIRACLAVYIWLLKEKYVPAVARAFAGHDLTEAQFAAALSFHYNTGAIEKAEWVKHWKAGRIDEAKITIMNWRSPPEIVPRREKERDLFFDGKWSQDGKATVYPVKKPSYKPDWRKAQRVDVSTEVAELL